MKTMFSIIFLLSLFYQLDTNQIHPENNISEIERAQEIEFGSDANELKSNISLSTHNTITNERLMNIRLSTLLFGFSSVSSLLKSITPNAPPSF